MQRLTVLRSFPADPELVKACLLIVWPGEDGLLIVSNDDLCRGEDLTVAHHVARERRPVRLAQHYVKVARLARECSNQRADLEMFLIGDDLQNRAELSESSLLASPH